MIELQLIGYTAELGHLVLDLVDGDVGRYRLRVDEDLFATLDELRERRRARGLPVGDLVEFADDLGLTRERLQQLQDDDARADAAAGRISTGAAAAERLLHEPFAPEPPDPADTSAGVPDEADEADETGPTVLAGWEDEATHDHVAGDPIVFTAPRETAPDPEPGPMPDTAPAAGPDPEAESGSGPRPGSGPPPEPVAEPDGEASVRIVSAPARPPAADESDGLVARALASHGLTPEPAAPSTSSTFEREPEPPAVSEPELAPEPEPEPEPAAAPEPDPASRPVPPPAPVEAPAAPPGTPPAQRPNPILSPAEIQSRLRSGRSVRAVARAAGVDEERIRRWEVPIVAERARVLDQARALRLERPRLGRSSQPLGEAVRRNLASRGVARDDVAWETSRRRDGRWRVCVRYVSRGRKRSATWTYDPEAGELRAASDTARELGFVRRRRR